MLSALNWELARTNTVFASRVYVKNECLSYCFFSNYSSSSPQATCRVFLFKDIFSRFPLSSYVFLPLTRGSLISMAQITRFPAFSSHRLPVHPRNSITMLFLTFCARYSIICNPTCSPKPLTPHTFIALPNKWLHIFLSFTDTRYPFSRSFQ